MFSWWATIPGDGDVADLRRPSDDTDVIPERHNWRNREKQDSLRVVDQLVGFGNVGAAYRRRPAPR